MNNSMFAASRRRSDKGVALIAVLLLLTLLSAVAVAMVYKVNH
jgi:type II secretory pathway component PulK